MLNRIIAHRLKKDMAHMPVVALLGARQVGKTTLAKSIAQQVDAIYLDLESPADLTKLDDPLGFLSHQAGKLLILDEIQQSPDLFKVLRGLVDQNRAQGRKSCQFLLLGSASIDLLRQSSESLAGRISYIEMGGLNLLEIPSQQPAAWQTAWLRGGFPDSYLAANDDMAMDWLEYLIRTYLERDIPQMGFRIPASRLRRLWTMLAHLQGEPLTLSKLGANLEVDGKTVRYYIDILVDLLLVRRLSPWHTNVKKRLVKSPRYYIRDSGIAHRLLGIDYFDALLSHPALGKSWEGFVMENIHSVLPLRAQTYFYRTAAGAELDLIIVLSASKIWAVEIKYGTAPKLRQHYHHICDEIGATEKYVIYSGNETFPIGQNTTVISLTHFLQKLQSAPIVC